MPGSERAHGRVSEGEGGGHPDFGLYAVRQVQRGRPREGGLPECDVVEVKPAGDDAWLTAAGVRRPRLFGQPGGSAKVYSG